MSVSSISMPPTILSPTIQRTPETQVQAPVDADGDHDGSTAGEVESSSHRVDIKA
ncbi:MAG: hypothetical protein H6855_06380 [Rhodospirillales bacterium]|nr:hypothetical protein [Rhodospirillales bacterium]MCB9965689.1 hypothetical protein [Rhodospirillales bacterium]MCB9980108.1 hypothetical protein [Rhodospirillales bacterium]